MSEPVANATPTVRVYGVAGCGPYEVAKLFLSSRGIPFEFTDLIREPQKHRELRARLSTPSLGVILEDGDAAETTAEVMQGVSIALLNRWLAGYRARHTASSPATPNR